MEGFEPGSLVFHYFQPGRCRTKRGEKAGGRLFPGFFLLNMLDRRTQRSGLRRPRSPQRLPIRTRQKALNSLFHVLISTWGK